MKSFIEREGRKLLLERLADGTEIIKELPDNYEFPTAPEPPPEPKELDKTICGTAFLRAVTIGNEKQIQIKGAGEYRELKPFEARTLMTSYSRAEDFIAKYSKGTKIEGVKANK